MFLNLYIKLKSFQSKFILLLKNQMNVQINKIITTNKNKWTVKNRHYLTAETVAQITTLTQKIILSFHTHSVGCIPFVRVHLTYGHAVWTLLHTHRWGNDPTNQIFSTYNKYDFRLSWAEYYSSSGLLIVSRTKSLLIWMLELQIG